MDIILRIKCAGFPLNLLPEPATVLQHWSSANQAHAPQGRRSSRGGKDPSFLFAVKLYLEVI